MKLPSEILFDMMKKYQGAHYVNKYGNAPWEIIEDVMNEVKVSEALIIKDYKDSETTFHDLNNECRRAYLLVEKSEKELSELKERIRWIPVDKNSD